MTKEQAKAQLALFHYIEKPTKREVALYTLYGENAPFLGGKELARVASINTLGGHQMKDLDEIMIELRGAKQLFSMLCTETVQVKDINGNNLQEALFSIEDTLENIIGDVEALINRK